MKTYSILTAGPLIVASANYRELRVVVHDRRRFHARSESLKNKTKNERTVLVRLRKSFTATLTFYSQHFSN